MRVTPAALRWIRGATVLRQEEDGRSVIQLSFPVREAAVAYALSRGPELEVLDPPEVREAVITAARSLLAAYS